MEKERRPKSLDRDETYGSIEGYLTQAKQDVQLTNYLDAHREADAAAWIGERFDTVGLLKSMWIEAEERNRGNGRRLLEAFLEDCADGGAEAVVLIADGISENEFDLIRWYERYGFERIPCHHVSSPVMVKTMEESTTLRLKSGACK